MKNLGSEEELHERMAVYGAFRGEILTGKHNEDVLENFKLE